tara:strand:+ start:719 stop:892 length:174 start_codon:yes stop_codon:yes gene_type:complete
VCVGPTKRRGWRWGELLFKGFDARMKSKSGEKLRFVLIFWFPRSIGVASRQNERISF